jgi:hypothetical protein
MRIDYLVLVAWTRNTIQCLKHAALDMCYSTSVTPLAWCKRLDHWLAPQGHTKLQDSEDSDDV